MASQSDFPPNSGEDKGKLQNPSSQAVQPAVQAREEAKVEPVKESAPPSVFVNSEPLREDQVQNAVKFLSHPKVQGSPIMYRRSFLERKGLAKEEIDEAFRRVPDPTPSVSTTQPAIANQVTDGQQKSSSNSQIQNPSQILQPVNAAPGGSITNVSALSRFHWSHALLAVGVLAVSGAGTAALFKKAVIPKFKSWIRKIVLEEEEDGLSNKSNGKPTLAEEAAAAAKAAAAAATDVARASQEMLVSKSEEKKYFQELTKLLGVQVREIKSMSHALQNLEVHNNTSRNTHAVEHNGYTVPAPASRQSYSNGKMDVDSRSVRSSSTSSPVESSAPPHPKSYMEIMAMVQRGEKPSNIRDIDDTPPNPNQPIPNPRAAPKPKPWEVSQTQYTSSNVFQAQQGNGYTNAKFQGNQSNGVNSGQWWQQKSSRISEIEAEDEQKSGSSGVLPSERPIQRSWVPPQPPPVAMAEAAAAIRQSKKATIPKEQLTDNQLLSHTSDVSDELQRITKISETGGSVDENGGSSGFNTSETPREEEPTYLEA